MVVKTIIRGWKMKTFWEVLGFGGVGGGDEPTVNSKRELGSVNERQMVPKSRDDNPEKFIRNRIVPPTSLPMEIIAFHAYMSNDSLGPLPVQHILKFDVVPLNKGGGYNACDGLFIVPTSGSYVFTWAIMSDVHGQVDS
ncbi:uncharacterized protein LOC134277154 [Saccostrea cucullata]|uniref:uncharacterized protein LOC134277154 n=1 Tax=Saccostrea cuccullata TaxID=36930 RepID=UPI002ED1239E